VDSPAELAAILHTQRELAFPGGILVTNPIPEQYSMDKAVIDKAIAQALDECNERGIHGKETTPFLLARIAEITGNDSLDSNIQLVFNNVALGAEIAKELCALRA
jgi:pseudouridine-5'-phosphate glycosidase